MGGKFKFYAQGSDLAPFDGNGTKIKIPSEIKSPLVQLSCVQATNKQNSRKY